MSFDSNVTVHSCWSSLYRATAQCGWLSIPSCLDVSSVHAEYSDSIDMEEYAHYDNPLNGGFHVVVPGEIIAFECPADLPGGASWADEQGVRRFGADFYADVFAEQGVGLVVRGDGSSYDARPFAARGIAVEDLPLDGGAELSLAQVDRFLSLVRLAPGAVAVHGGPGGLGAAGTLVAVLLISAHGFGAEEAVAWVRMAHPAALPAARMPSLTFTASSRRL